MPYMVQLYFWGARMRPISVLTSAFARLTPFEGGPAYSRNTLVKTSVQSQALRPLGLS
jgi:hypothetical protein